MDINPWTIYWITRLDAFITVFRVIAGASALIFFFMFALSLDFDYKKLRNCCLGKILLCLCIICCICLIFIPTTNQMCSIYIIPKIANSKSINKVANDLIIYCQEWLESRAKEMK